MLRRAAIGFAAAISLIAAGLVVTAWWTSTPADPALYPAGPGESVHVYVIARDYHSGLLLPRAALARQASLSGHARVLAVATRFGAYSWLELGWGEERFYTRVPTIDRLEWRLALNALFAPGNASVVHVVGVGEDVRSAFPNEVIGELKLSPQGFDRLLAALDGTLAADPAGQPIALGRGLYGPSLFYRSSAGFSLLSVCNHWVGRLLAAAGVPTIPVLDTLPAGLVRDLEWRAGMRPIASAASENLPSAVQQSVSRPQH